MAIPAVGRRAALVVATLTSEHGEDIGFLRGHVALRDRAVARLARDAGLEV